MSLELQEELILKDSGFSKCTFEPDDMTCEGCGLPYLRLYYRRTCYENDEGEYKCLCCIAVRKAENEAEGRCIDVEQDLAQAAKMLQEAHQYFSTYNSNRDCCDDCGEPSWVATPHAESCITVRYEALLKRLQRDYEYLYPLS